MNEGNDTWMQILLLSRKLPDDALHQGTDAFCVVRSEASHFKCDHLAFEVFGGVSIKCHFSEGINFPEA